MASSRKATDNGPGSGRCCATASRLVRPLRSAGAVVAAATVVVALSAAGATAVTKSSISVSPASVQRGGTVVIYGAVPNSGDRACMADNDVILTSTSGLFPGDGFGPHVPRDASGAFRHRYTIPLSTPPGRTRSGCAVAAQTSVSRPACGSPTRSSTSPAARHRPVSAEPVRSPLPGNGCWPVARTPCHCRDTCNRGAGTTQGHRRRRDGPGTGDISATHQSGHPGDRSIRTGSPGRALS